jgi:gliding motility-associated-like protein
LGYTQTIRLTLSAPIAVDGLYYVKVQSGSDGNTFFDSCGRVLPVDEQFPFVVNSFNGQLNAHPDDTVICNVGTMIPLYGENNGIAPNNGFQYQWTPTNGIQNPNALNTSVIVPDSLNHYVLSTVDSNGCYLRDSVHIRAEDFHANFDYTVNLGCAKDTVHFQNSTTAGAISYYWQFGDGQTDTIFEPTHLYAQGGYMVMLTATNGYCSDSILHSVSVNHPLVADFTAAPDTLCMGDIVTFTNNSTATTANGIDPAYTWDFGDGTGDNTLNPTHQYPDPGTYTVMLVAQNFIPCMDTAYQVVQVDSMPGLSFAASSSQICKGDHITFNASNVNSGLQSLAWNFGYNADTVYNLNPVQASYDEVGTYTVTLHGDYAVCPDTTFSIDITVNPIPVINLGADTSICLNGQPIILKDNINASNPMARWLWNTGDTTASIEVRHEGIYTSRVTIANCTAEDEVDIKKDCYIDIPNSFTPNNDGHNDYFFPRQLLSDGVLQFSMSIFNRWGEKIFDTQNPEGRGWDGNFNGKTQPTGVYVYTMELMLKNGKTEHYSGNVTLLR